MVWSKKPPQFLQSLQCWHLALARVGATRYPSGQRLVYRIRFSVLVPPCLGMPDTVDMAHTARTADMADMADMATRGITAVITAVTAQVTMDRAGAGSPLSSGAGGLLAH